MLGRDFSDYAYLPASHTRGGILTAGRQSDVAFSDVLVGCYSITSFSPHAVRGRAKKMVADCRVRATGRRRQGTLPGGP